MSRFALLALIACSAPAKPVAVPVAPVAAVAPIPLPPAALTPAQPTVRLPRNFLPTGYTATLKIDPAMPTFDGTIAIAGQVSEPSSAIWLYARHLKITSSYATRADSQDRVELATTPKAEELIEIRPARVLAAGAWTLHFDYVGELDDLDTTGAFREVAAGERYVFTQFEAVYARRVFPCFDEPDNKVPWQLALEVPAGAIAVSNTAVATTTDLPNGGKRFEFEPTRPLPSYLVAFGVGPFEFVDAGKTTSGVAVRMIVPKGRTADVAYPAKTIARVTDLLEAWFGTGYPFPKLDWMAIPITVGFGAMENPGLVTGAERITLLDPQKASLERRHGWIATSAHELAHQWFGDLVTTAWWDDIWLNEGFANWMETKIVEGFEPAWHERLVEWKMREEALTADRLITARKIRQPIATTDDIFGAFDGITYNKGASVLNMFEHYVGAETFQRGVRDYLRDRAYGNATSNDFIAAISKVAGKDLAPAFSSFLDRPGAPLLDVSVSCEPTGAKLVVHQQRFTLPGSAQPPSQGPWIVPICAAFEESGALAEACGVIDADTGELPLGATGCPRWVMPNSEGRGYYRIAFSAAQLTALRDEAWPMLSEAEKLTLAGDARALVATGHVPLQLALSLAPKLLAIGDRFAAQEALALPLAIERFVPDELHAKYENWMRQTFGPTATKLGFQPGPKDDFDSESIRSSVVAAVAWQGRDPVLVKQAIALAQHWQDLPQAIREPVLRVAVDADAALFDRVLSALSTEPDRRMRTDMISALGQVRDVARFERALPLLLDRKFDFREAMQLPTKAKLDATIAVAVRFVREHQDPVLARMPRDETNALAGGFLAVFTSTCRAEQRTQIAEYLASAFGSFPGAHRAIAQAVEGMDQCIASRSVYEPAVRAWLGGSKLPKPKSESTPAPKAPAKPAKPAHH